MEQLVMILLKVPEEEKQLLQKVCTLYIYSKVMSN